MITPAFSVDFRGFNRLIGQHSAQFGKTRNETLKSQARLLTKELIQRTPPLSGKTIKKILKAQGRTPRNPELETMKDRKVGERAIIRDRRRVARKIGLISPRGTIPRDRESQRQLNDAIKDRLKRVGRAKAGWVPGHVRAGGKQPGRGGWLGRHGNTQGAGFVRVRKGRIEFEASNKSEWTELGESQRIVRQSLARRERAMKNQLKRALEKQLGRGAGAAFAR